MTEPLQAIQTEPFLILHKVSGNAAFDVAIQMQIGSEKGWIIPTSGHRAYPHKWWPINMFNGLALNEVKLPTDLPDHYQQELKAHTNGPKPAPARREITIEDIIP